MALVPARDGSLCLVESSQGSMDSRGSQGLTRPGNFPKSLRFPETLVHEIGQEQLERLLLWCVEMRASDIVFCPGDPVWLQRDGLWFPVTDTPLNDAEIQAIVNTTSGQSNRAGLVKTGHSIDYAATVRIPGQRVLRQRFRVNATSSNKGLYVVMRALPGSIPRLDDMEGLTSAQKKALFPEAGLVVVSGVMGSGKSTLLAAILHEASLKSGRQILTLEDPIEFDFSQLPIEERAAPITQSAVHIDVEDWASGVRTLTRRKGEIVMVGECRDRETIRALLTTVEQGVNRVLPPTPRCTPRMCPRPSPAWSTPFPRTSVQVLPRFSVPMFACSYTSAWCPGRPRPWHRALPDGWPCGRSLFLTGSLAKASAPCLCRTFCQL